MLNIPDFENNNYNIEEECSKNLDDWEYPIVKSKGVLLRTTSAERKRRNQAAERTPQISTLEE
jgi:hypothetical protein